MEHNAQDEDLLWRRAFADSSGLFGDCNVNFFASTTSLDNLFLPSNTSESNSSTASALETSSPPVQPAPPTTTTTTSTPFSPMVTSNTNDIPCLQLAPDTVIPIAEPMRPSSTPLQYIAPPRQQPLPAPPQQQPRQPILPMPSAIQPRQSTDSSTNNNSSAMLTHMGQDWLSRVGGGGWTMPSMMGTGALSAVQPASTASSSQHAAAAAAAILRSAGADEDDFQGGGATQQRGGNSCARKRERAKLLRQQMNDGLDSLHEALVEISSSGANPSAAATTGLIPTRGPRRAAVVACSSSLVRDLISTCVALRAQNAALAERLTSVQSASASAASPTQLGPGDAAGGTAAGVVAEGDRASETCPGDGLEGLIGSEVNKPSRGIGAATVFGQLLSLNVYGFLGPQALEEGRKVCRSWRDKCAWDCNWSNLCVSRWRLCPAERHAEVWRTPKCDEMVAVVSPPEPPPTWRQVYGRLHRELRVPTGALNPVHLVIGRSVEQGIAVWIALSRRSNGQTTRSVMGSNACRTTEVIELRAVIQRVDEGPAIAIHPRAFRVRRIHNSSSGGFNNSHHNHGQHYYNNNSHIGAGSGSSSSCATYPSAAAAAAAVAAIPKTDVFPSISDGDSRFSPRIAINTGVANGADHQAGTSASTAAGVSSSASHYSNGRGWGTGAPAAAAASASGRAPRRTGKLAMLALYEYAAIDFFVETKGIPTERDFLRLATCVDVGVSTAAEACPSGGERRGAGGLGSIVTVLPVVLNERQHEPVALGGASAMHDFGETGWRPHKRRTHLV